MNKSSLFILLILFSLPLLTEAQVTQVNFITDPQTIYLNEISNTITIQLQDLIGDLSQTTETIDVEFLSSSPTGEFLSPTTDSPVTTTIASSTANKNFRYRDSSEGSFVVTVNLTGRDSGVVWSTEQSINVLSPPPVVNINFITGAVSSSTTWSSFDGVYVLEDAITVPFGVTLNIEPGTIIKAKTGGAGSLTISGRLVVSGSADEPVHFTSFLDDEFGGDTDGNASTTGTAKDWKGIYFEPGSSGEIDYAVIHYAGYVGAGSQSGVDNNGGEVVISNSVISDNYHKGVFNHNNGTLKITNSKIENNLFGVLADSGVVSIEESNILNNSEYGVYVAGVDGLNLTNNSFSSNGKTLYVNASADFIHQGNTSEDLTSRGFEISGNIRNGAEWHTNDLPFINTGGLTIKENEIATFFPGTIVKMLSGAFLDVRGSLFIEGDKTNPVYFTSIKDDEVMGDTNVDSSASSPVSTDWNGITFYSGSVGNISNTFIKYSGGYTGLNEGSGRSGIFNLGGTIILSKTSFSNNYQSDIYQNSGSLSASSTDFFNTQYGIIFTGGTGIISDSKFYTSTNAIDNQSPEVIDARNNWWGSEAGPTIWTNSDGDGARINGLVLFTPWLVKDPLAPPPRNPVIIVPGIMGSYLNKEDGGEVWINLLKMVLPNDEYLDDLILSEDGESSEVVLTPTSIIESVDTHLFKRDNFFSLINTLVSSGYEDKESLFTFPYDWRLDIDVSALKLKERIDEIKLQTGADKVDLIAHSMGGLLVKALLKDYGGESIDKFVDIATPHIGSPESFSILNYGNTGISILNSNRVKTISQNMPSIYQLLPSREYFDDSNSNYKYYIFDGINGNNRLTFDKTKDYLNNAGRNNLLVEKADEFHQSVDGLDPANYGVKTYNIVGCGVPTLGQIYILGKKGEEFSYNIHMINGDGTVPLRSAEAIPALETYYVKNIQHALLPSVSGVRDLVISILNNEDNFNISVYPNLTPDISNCSIPNGTIISFHSPVELHIYDEAGNHTGPDVSGDIENNIEGVDYEVIENNKFAFLPKNLDYKIVGKATDQGVFDIRIQEVVNEEVSTTTMFTNIPIISTTQAEFNINSTVPSQISIDNDGDGIFESEKGDSAVVVGFVEFIDAPSPDVSTKVVSLSSSSSKKSVAVETAVNSINVEEINIPINKELDVVKIKPNEVVAAITKEIVVEEKEPITPSELVYKNTATVYQTVKVYLKIVFERVWLWFKSKL